MSENMRRRWATGGGIKREKKKGSLCCGGLFSPSHWLRNWPWTIRIQMEGIQLQFFWGQEAATAAATCTAAAAAANSSNGCCVVLLPKHIQMHLMSIHHSAWLDGPSIECLFSFFRPIFSWALRFQRHIRPVTVSLCLFRWKIVPLTASAFFASSPHDELSICIFWAI